MRIDGEKIGGAIAEALLKRLNGDINVSNPRFARIDVGFDISERDSA